MLTKLKSLKNHQGFMKYFKNTSWLFGEKILRMIVGFFVGIWVARYLGPEQFGLFSYAQSFVGLFTAIATLGLDRIVVKELVKDERRRDEILGTVFWLKVMGAFGVLIILAIAVNFTSNDSYTNTLVFIIASATIFQSFNVVDMHFQAKVMGKFITYANVISLLLSSIVKIVLILLHAPLIAFAWTVVFDSVVLSLGYVYFFIKTNSKFKIQNLIFQRETAVSLLMDSWPLMMGGVSFVVYSNIDNIMIKELLDEYSVGIYNAAYKIVTLWYFLPGLFLTYLMPSLVNVHLDTELFMERVLKTATLLVWMAFFIVFFFYLFGRLIIDITYGEKYFKAIKLLTPLAFVNILIFYNSVWNYWMIIENKTKRTLFFNMSTAVANIILNYLFITLYGVVGAVYALLVSLQLSYLIFGLSDFRMIKMFINAFTLKILWGKR
jgi:O-antigen/teichoic acid export membrane protein